MILRSCLPDFTITTKFSYQDTCYSSSNTSLSRLMAEGDLKEVEDEITGQMD